jgi:predicted homoserine dehydrogenase-like protein
MIYQHLFDRVEDPETVRAGLIGAGQFGTPIITQAPIIPRLEVPVVADIDVEAGRPIGRRASQKRTLPCVKAAPAPCVRWRRGNASSFRMRC